MDSKTINRLIREATGINRDDFDFVLNAMHEAEKVLVKQELWQLYMQKLSEKICADADEPVNYDIETQWEMIHATARQRAEAFLRTLGKWKD